MDQRVREGYLSSRADEALGTRAAGPSRLAIWSMAARPKTLLLSLSPVLMGGFLAFRDSGTLDVAVFLMALVGAIAIQIGTNLWNDALDGARGHDRAGRLGPPRVTALGLAPAASVRRAALVSFAIATLAGLGLAIVGGLPIIALGVVSMLCGLAYSAGPRPISYTPFGELFVIAFFGVAAVAGTYYLQTGAVSGDALAGGIVMGFPAAAVLLVNNHRDRASDARAGRRTLAILVGERGAHRIYAGLLGLGVAGTLSLVWPHCLLGLVAFVPSIGLASLLASRIFHVPVSTELNKYLAGTGLVQFLMVISVALATLICNH
ncbi:MAG TPA: 1,4-dihydroxy-2-naphthoate octaprenyltransferase [Candidatus Ozemobacteraceae bacterium]|nr:1,4-dihydroxy-2-naphthoate octaprenyltransferase [Candidatus Ozemobacteraceae bacterium]